MQLDRREIERALLKKGFVEEGGDHKYFYHEIAGKRTGAYAYVSRGSSYKTYGANLIKRMRITLLLESTKHVYHLVKCPLSAGRYSELVSSQERDNE